MFNNRKENNSQENFLDIEDPEERQKIKSAKKDTKRWCKGKVGVEHTAICMTYEEAKHLKDQDLIISFNRRGRWLVCTTCGKELRFYYPNKKNKKPDWVDK